MTRREFLQSIFKPLLLARFLAKQIDLFLVHVLAAFFYILVVGEDSPFDLLAVSLLAMWIFVVVEAILIRYCNTTPGKFFMGLRVYSSSFFESLTRSVMCALLSLGLGLGYPFLGMILALGFYVWGIFRPIPWDRYGAFTLTRKDAQKGLIVASLLVGLFVAFLVGSYFWQAQNRDLADGAKIEPSQNLVTEIGYPLENLEEAEVDPISKTLWVVGCQAGALQLIEHTGHEFPQNGKEIIDTACLKSVKQLSPLDEKEPDSLFLKACGLGIGIAAQMINFNKLDEQLLESICLPNIQ